MTSRQPPPFPPDQTTLEPGAEGIKLNAAASDDPVANDTNRRVYWARTSDGAVVAHIVGTTTGTPNRHDSLELHGGIDKTGGVGSAIGTAGLSGLSRFGGEAQISLEANDLGGNTEIALAAISPGAVAQAFRTLLRSTGASDFIQHLGESVRAIRGAITITGVVLAGQGFTVTKGATGLYTVNLDTPQQFGDPAPTILLTPNQSIPSPGVTIVTTVLGGFTYQTFSTPTGAAADCGVRMLALYPIV